MAYFTHSWFLDVILSFSSLLLAVYLFYKYSFQYWKRRGVPYTDPSFPFGDMGGAGVNKTVGEAYKALYDESRGLRFLGGWAFFNPFLLVNDPELIKTMFIKDFMSFHDRGLYVNEKDDPLAAHLFTLGGMQWKRLRNTLSPTFTSGKMKMMFPILLECAEHLKAVLEAPAGKGEDIEVKDIAARFTTDVIASCAFGIKTNSLTNPDAGFRVMAQKLNKPSLKVTARVVLSLTIPKLAEFLRTRITPEDVAEYFLGVVKDTIEYRERNEVRRNDFMDLLIQLKNKGRLEEVEGQDVQEAVLKPEKTRRLTFEEAAAEAFVFYLAGFDTSSSVIQYAIYELALHPEIQGRLREEMRTTLEQTEGKLSYETLFSMEYLGRVIDETLRKYPPVPFLNRECSREYLIPGTEVRIARGTAIVVPVLGLHRDPTHFPLPETFDPDRFSDPAARQNLAYLPFGDGPRSCIGMRFGLMQTRVGLVTLLMDFQFTVSERTPIPMVYDPKSIFLAPKDGMHLKITKLQQ